MKILKGADKFCEIPVQKEGMVLNDGYKHDICICHGCFCLEMAA